MNDENMIWGDDLFYRLTGTFVCNNFGCRSKIDFDNGLSGNCGYEEEYGNLKDKTCWVVIEGLSLNQMRHLVQEASKF